MHQHSNLRRPAAVPALPADPRWEALELLRAARGQLGLKDRGIAVMRGLLSLVPAASWEGAPFVHAANRTLQERCDGMDERTLRRHLAQLCAFGLIRRQTSPNRKRYVVRDETGTPILSYGFDLTPLREALPRLRALADTERQMQTRLRALRAVLRDRLWQLTEAGIRTETVAALQPLLRRKTTVATLEAAIAELAESPVPASGAPLLTDSHGQIDRHIQSSDKEHSDMKEPPQQREAQAETAETPRKAVTVSLSECRHRARAAMDFAEDSSADWPALAQLSRQLAPGIGLDPQLIDEAEGTLGREGRTLAIFGLIEALPRIRRPDLYLRKMLKSAREGRLCIGRMFHSLTSAGLEAPSRFPAGNPA